MAFPFGGHPTFGQYLIWARDSHGFTARTGIGADDLGRSHSVTRIFREGGPSVIIPGIKQNDRLTPSFVGYLDRRLGINSPWFSVDDGPPPDSIS